MDDPNVKSNLLVLQARLGSKRLPGKVLLEVAGKPLILHQIERIRCSKLLDQMVVAIPLGEQDDLLATCLQDFRVPFFRGDELNVFSRFQASIKEYSADVIVRSTADCPLFMAELLDQMLLLFDKSDVDYLSNCLPPTFPDGLDIEIFSRKSFESLNSKELSSKQKEHVTLAYYDNSNTFKTLNFPNEHDLSHERWSVDYIEDFRFIEQIMSSINPLSKFDEVLQFLKQNPTVRNSKSGNFRNIALLEDNPDV